MTTVPVVLSIAGVAALFLSFWGGIKIQQMEIPPAPPKVRFIVGVIGAVFIGYSMWQSSITTNNGQQPAFAGMQAGPKK